MELSLNWLKQHLDLGDHTLQQIDDLLTFAGIEVEGVAYKGVGTDKVVVAQIVSAEQHPDADKLKVCMIDAGEDEKRQIVCGAKNYKVGDKVPCALPGADLGNGFVIKEGKLRGIESKGMLCAANEIGLTDEEDGLMILPADSSIGTKLQDLFDSDTIITVEITPNRPDLLSHVGMARELSALLNRKFTEPAIELLATTNGEALIDLQTDDCPLYTGIRINGVKVAPSPTWLVERLEAIGLRPINNVVDITNFVLHELGHPLHAFDATKVQGKLTIRKANDGEVFKALDEADYTLTPDDTVISDEAGTALALGGIMGGLDSGVTDTTTEIILEAAYFEPSTIRRTSRRLILSSDSSYRFERGTDPQQVVKSASFAAKLIVEIAGGTIDDKLSVAGAAPNLTDNVSLDIDRLHQLMGGNITTETAENILSNLGLKKATGHSWSIPSYRLDLQRHIDLVEEIARVHGLDNITSRMLGTFVDASSSDHDYDTDLNLKKRLVSLGFFETQTIKLISETQLRDALPTRPLQDGDLIKVALPLSEDHSIMRPSLVPGLVTSAERNIRQGRDSLRFFELGRQFRNAGGGKAKDLEADSLAFLIGGKKVPAHWSGNSEVIDIYDAKAVLSAIVPQATVQIKPKAKEGFVLSGDIQADGKPIGAFAQLSPARCRELDANYPIYVVELDASKLRKLNETVSAVTELPQFPGSSRDVAIEASIDLPNSDIETAITKANESLLVSYHCLSIFTDPSGEKLATDKKSIAYSLTYRSGDKTLKAKEVDDAHQRVLATLKKKLNIEFR